jgi:uncharacterized Fe-S center protein
MSTVYLKKITAGSNEISISQTARYLLEYYLKNENVTLRKEVPLKVHFGEKGNSTYIKPQTYDGIIDLLQEQSITTSFIETSVLYGGERFKKELHLERAKKHGFTRIPIIIADGEQGELFSNVTINKRHFSSCKIAQGFEPFDQIIVLAHFKGHMFAGFGGAIKQLSMGFASRGGKLAMHFAMKPQIIGRKCRQCHLCESRCNEKAITIGKKSFIDHAKCVGCSACVAICPHKAVSIYSPKTLLNVLTGGTGNTFREKLAEYALAAHNGKKNIYMNFLINVTSGCDCEPRTMKKLMPDIGILIANDPVAVDKASYDLVSQYGKAFKGSHTFKYAESIGLGSAAYTLKEV